MVYKFDDQERIIARELVKNPRTSDNQIGKKTGIPVKTVNRKRKKLETLNILQYYTELNHSTTGTGHLPARQLHIITFKAGITRKKGLDSMMAESANEVLTKHIPCMRFGEQQGHLVLVYHIESYHSKDLLEIFNAEIVPLINRYFGEDSIKDMNVIDMTVNLRQLHNYLPGVNIKDGHIRDDWPNNHIFVD